MTKQRRGGAHLLRHLQECRPINSLVDSPEWCLVSNMVSIANQYPYYLDQRGEQQVGFGLDNQRSAFLNVLDQIPTSPDEINNLQNWMAKMSIPTPPAKSANITERVGVPSSEHVAEIVGRQGEHCTLSFLEEFEIRIV